MPEKAIAINKVLLNFKLKNFRAYTNSTQTSSGGTSHTHTVTISSSGDHGHNIGYLTDDWGCDSGYPCTVAIGSTTGSGDHTHGTIVSTAENTHTHNITMSFGIYEISLSSPSVDVYTGEDGGTMTKKGTYTTDQTNLDITNEIRDIGAGKWINIQFRPNKKMRIEANAYIQIFIQSEA